MTFKQFLLLIAPRVQAFVTYNQSHTRYQTDAYRYIRGDKSNRAELAFNCLSKYFTDFKAAEFHINDRSGFTAIQCSYGTMPCFLEIRFYVHALLMHVYRGRPDSSGERYSCGEFLFGVEVREGGAGGVMEVARFENILK